MAVGLADRTAEQTLFVVEGDPRSAAQVAEDARLAERLNEVRSVADALGMTTRELAALAYVASGKVAPLDLTAQRPAATTDERDRWGYILPRFRFGRQLDALERAHVPEEERNGARYEHRAWRFEVSRLVPGPVRRWLGNTALFVEIGPFNYRKSQLEKRMERMHHNEAMTDEITAKAKQAREEEEQAVADKRAAIEDRAYHRTLKPLAQRDRAQARLTAAQVRLEEAEASQRRSPSYASEQAVAAARQSRDRARINYEAADSRAALHMALGFFEAWVNVDRDDRKRGARAEKALSQARGDEYRRTHPVVVVGWTRTLS